MKIKGLVSLLLCLGLFTGCHNSDDPVILTYGSEIDSEGTDISGETFDDMIDHKESFVLCIYDSKTCGCWSSLSKYINDFVSEDTRIVYTIHGPDYSGSNKLPFYSGESSIALYEKGKLKESWRYSNDKDTKYFTTKGEFTKLMNEYTTTPSMVWTDKEHLEEHKENDDILNVVHMRSDCSDCSYCFPNVLVPYFYDKDTVENPLYVIDLAVDGILYEDGVEKDKTYEPYVEYATEFELTEDANQIFGYGEGYVPSFQRWEKGKLKDASVYLNDKISKNDNGEYYISESYYTEERVKNLGYKANVLEGTIVSEDELIIIGDDDIYYIPASFAKYHDINLTNFLDKYIY